MLELLDKILFLVYKEKRLEAEEIVEEELEKIENNY